MRKVERGNHSTSEIYSQVNLDLCQHDGRSSGRAEQLFATHGKTFYFAARFFPPSYRSAVVVLYEFFRTLDDLVDIRPRHWVRAEIRQELDGWHAWFRDEFRYAAPREPLGTRLAAVIREYAIPVSLFQDFLDGLISDLEPTEFQSFRELYRYCYRVAGTVGLTMAHVMGARSEQALMAARHLGIAMQLTNILRDVSSDLATHRLYIPADELERFGSSATHLRSLYAEQKLPDERFCALMRYQIQRARFYYARGLQGIWLLPTNCRLPVLLAGRLYQRILYEIERLQYNILHKRAATSLLTKVREAGVVFLLDRLWRQGEVEVPGEMEMFYED